MTVEVRSLGDREEWLGWRAEHMTSSVGACLFGAEVHPYTSAYQQWALKSGLLPAKPIDPKLARRGQYIEKIAPDIIAEERPDWEVTPNPYYYCDPEERIGTTPDLWARCPVRGYGLIDVKSVGPATFRRWRDEDTGDSELPVWMAIQVNIQAAMVGAYWGAEDIKWGAVAAITIGDAGLDAEIIDVPIMPGVAQTFRELAKDFWRRVAAKEPYPVDWGKDAAAILETYRDEDGSTVDIVGDPEFGNLLWQREEFKRTEEAGTKAEKLRKVIDAQIIARMGNSRAARYGGTLVKAPTIKVQEAMRKAYSFRKITVSQHQKYERRLSDETL
jgi:hypothetical protein